MNYLAHFHLSYGNDDLLLGALLGDFVKGPLQGRLDSSLEQGIELHRKIDAFTDSHPITRDLQKLFDPGFRRFGGIMTDVVFDHFLNRHWDHFHHQSLTAFSAEIYQLIEGNKLLPPAAMRQADNLVRYDVFGSYRHWQTVDGALTRISQRFSRANPLSDAAVELDKHYHKLEQGFLEFYPLLIQHSAKIRSQFIEKSG